MLCWLATPEESAAAAATTTESRRSMSGVGSTSSATSTGTGRPMLKHDKDMVRIDMVRIRPLIGDPTREDMQLSIALEPLKAHLDYDTIMFLASYVPSLPGDGPPAGLFAPSTTSAALSAVTPSDGLAQATEATLGHAPPILPPPPPVAAAVAADEQSEEAPVEDLSIGASVYIDRFEVRSLTLSLSLLSSRPGRTHAMSPRCGCHASSSFTQSPISPDAPSSTFPLFPLPQLSRLVLSIDFAPKAIDFGSVYAGDYLRLINLFPLEGFSVTLPAIVVQGAEDWDVVGGRLLMQLKKEIKWLVPRYLSSVKPIQPLLQLGAGAKDLVMIPLYRLRKDGRFFLGIREGILSFVSNSAKAFAQTGVMVMNLAGGALGSAASYLQPEAADASAGTLGGRLAHVVGHGRSARAPETVEASALRKSRRPGEARSVQEGLALAAEELNMAMVLVSRNIIAMPLQQYRRSGSNARTAITVIRAVPTSILRPIAGAAKAVTEVLSGVQSSLEGQQAAELDAKYKSPAGRRMD